MPAPIDDVPRWARWVYRALLPQAYAEDVLHDLADDARRRAVASRTSRHLWHARQLLSSGTLRLAWALRGARAAERGPRGPAAWVADLAQAARGLRRDVPFTLAAAGSLGLGLGATVAILSVADAVLLRPPPYQAPDELVFVWNRLEGFESNRLPLSGVQVAALRSERGVFDDVAGVWATTRTVSFDEGSTLVSAATITPNLFAMLGIAPLLGPGFGEDEGADGSSTVLLSHAFWERELGADPAVVGSTLRVEGESAIVMGVLPADARLVFPQDVGVPARVDLFMAYPWVAAEDPRGPRFLRAVARLRDGVDVATADRAVRDVSSRLRDTYAHMAASGDLFHAVPLRGDVTQARRPLVLALLAGVALFLLLTCVNVASLLAARRAARVRDLAVRRCLGASSWGLTRLLLAEVGLLSALGALVAGVVGVWGLGVLWALRPEALAGVESVSTRAGVLLAAGAVVLLAGGVTTAASLPAVRPVGPDHLLRATSSLGARALRPRRALVACELALSVVLVVGAVLLGGSLRNLRAVPLGFAPEGVATFRVGISNRAFPGDAERARLAEEVRQAIAQLPGVVSVGATSHIPLADWANWSGDAPPVGTPEGESARFHFDHRSVTPGYFDAIGTRIVEGRAFRGDDGGDARPAVIVDEAYARRVFAAVDDVVGREVVATRYVNRGFVPTTATVVGVVESVRDHDPARPSAGQIFWPFAQSARWELTFAARLDAASPEWAARVRETVAGVHRDLAVADVRPLASFVEEAAGPLRFAALLGTVFSALAILLACLGLYGVVAYSMRQRVGEIGVRLALGARRADVFGSVVREGATIGAVGVAVGLAGAVLGTRFLDALLFEVDPLDARVLGAVAVGLLFVALAASAVPASRASRLDPARTLRPE